MAAAWTAVERDAFLAQPCANASVLSVHSERAPCRPGGESLSTRLINMWCPNSVSTVLACSDKARTGAGRRLGAGWVRYSWLPSNGLGGDSLEDGSGRRWWLPDDEEIEDRREHVHASRTAGIR
jgi:hypothetical protein